MPRRVPGGTQKGANCSGSGSSKSTAETCGAIRAQGGAKKGSGGCQGGLKEVPKRAQTVAGADSASLLRRPVGELGPRELPRSAQGGPRKVPKGRKLQQGRIQNFSKFTAESCAGARRQGGAKESPGGRHGRPKGARKKSINCRRHGFT